jgi:carbon monoxide dehydrogenase subunit G
VRLEQSFDVAAPIDRVWTALVDVEQVVPCLPGAAVTGRNEDGSYDGTFTVKIGPTTAAYAGRLSLDSVDEARYTATIHAQGTDKRGQGGASATIVSVLTAAADNGTHVAVDTDYRITGRLARFGRGGMIEDISERLLRQFAERLQASLMQGEPGAVAEVASASSPEAEREASVETEYATVAPADEGAGPARTDAGGAAARTDARDAAAPTDARDAAAPTDPGDAAAPTDPGDAPTRVSAVPVAGADGGPGAEVRAPESAEHLDALPFLRSALWGRLRHNPAPIAFVIGLLLGILAARRQGRHN